MLYINRTSTDPYFNLAAEEYVLKNFSEDCFMLWQNSPCVVVGKHQNTLAEINYEYIRKKNIPVVRRISGGGTVFHDPGNLNFTFVQNIKDENLVNFRKFTAPILAVLETMGVHARFEGKNNLTLAGLKFSGNAEHVYKKRTLHHGTLLYSSRLSELSDALKFDPHRYTDKAVKSIRSRITNLQDFMKEKISISEFKNRIRDFVLDQYSDTSDYEFTKTDIENIEELVRSKYATWEWNFGYSPKYNFRRSIEHKGGKITFNVDVKEGHIQNAKVSGDLINVETISDFEKRLTGIPHREKNIANKLHDLDVKKYFHNLGEKEVLQGFF
ncbi:MAG: lipoate--protein ligase [Bacteroidales bacterium]|nr:lipoate--protein ligase [Bacteroidales bacterium]MCF8388374.1 lipoate--protein ligase [Bacteroidales bacterium]MCF8396531.1 lipoate--protein ligase [Bacteroidales bacterium]